jgi:single-strand DNA-binding protein
MQLLGSREGMGEGESRGSNPAPAVRPAGGGAKPAPKSATGFDDMDDDIPF